MVQQLLFRAGAPSRTVALNSCGPQDDVHSVKEQLWRSAGALVGQPQDMVLMHEGRVLQDGTPLSAYPALWSLPLASSSTCQHASSSSSNIAEQLPAPPVLQVLSRLRGGGGDGGSTGAESRSCYLEMYQGKKPDKVNPTEGLLARWTRCQLSGAELSPPCVVDELGCLYNKDALLAALLAKAVPPHLSYITGLRSVTEVKLTRRQPSGSRAGASGAGAGAGAGGAGGAPKAAVKGLHNPGNEAEFCCPITDLECNGRFKFVVHRPTGYVVSEKAVKELPQVVEELVGSKPTPDDWIPVNPSGDQLEALKVKVAAKQAADREKKAKKAAKQHQQQLTSVGTTDNGTTTTATAAATNGKALREASPAAEAKPAANGTALKRPGSGSPGPAPAAAAASAAAAAPVVTGAMLPPAKKPKTAPALAAMPRNASSNVYASLFTSSLPEGADKETYLCRSTSARGVHLS